jgi:hypothetical protein
MEKYRCGLFQAALLVLPLGLTGGFIGCSAKEAPQTSRVYQEIFIQKKNIAGPSMSGLSGVPSQEFTGVWSWETPKGWEETSGEGLRLVSFQIVEDGDIIEGSIVRFPGTGGSIQSNVARWMKQVEVRVPKGKQMERYVSKLPVLQTRNGYPATIVDLTSSLSGNMLSSNSMLASVIQAKDHKLFIKLTGNKSALKKQLNHFISLNESMMYQSSSSSDNSSRDYEMSEKTEYGGYSP